MNSPVPCCLPSAEAVDCFAWLCVPQPLCVGGATSQSKAKPVCNAHSPPFQPRPIKGGAACSNLDTRPGAKTLGGLEGEGRGGGGCWGGGMEGGVIRGFPGGV